MDSKVSEENLTEVGTPTPMSDPSAPILDTPNPTKVPPKKRIGLILVGGILAVALGGYAIHAATQSNKPAKTEKRNQITPVTVAKVTQKTVPVQLKAIGNVQASSTVSVTPQASGRITRVFFKKGQEVSKGQLLFTLDDRSQMAAVQQAQGALARDLALVQQAKATMAKDMGLVQQARTTLAKDMTQVKQARATLAKDRAQADYTQATSKRYSDLYKQGGVSRDQAQQFSANSKSSTATLQVDSEAIANAQAVVEGDKVAISNAQAVIEGDRAAIANAEAVVRSDRAALENTRVLLSYSKIYAPIDGRAGNVLVTEGNVVQANSTTPLATITKIHPVQVSFSIPESNLPDLQQRMENGRLRVDVTFAGSTRSSTGLLTFINNTVDNTTGTIQLIGDFDNAQGNLFPGQFVNTTLTLNTQPNATVVPAQAVQNGPNGQFVFVVKPDRTVENVPVTVSSTINGLDVVRKGLNLGDTVVTDGQANLTSGSKVRVKTGSGSAMGGDANSVPSKESNSEVNVPTTAGDRPAPGAKDPRRSPRKGGDS
jgi:membrane fusion protein, multidrug efflux system